MPASPQSVSRNPVNIVKRRPWFGRAIATGFALAACLGSVFYRRPLWVINASIRAWLSLVGVRSNMFSWTPSVFITP